MNIHAMKPAPSPMPQANLATPSTPSTLHDELSIASSKLAGSEQMQLNLAIRNSLKESFRKSSFTPEGIHISQLRTQRRLFNETDKQMLSGSKRPAIYEDLTGKTPSPDMSSPKSAKSANRLHNNKLNVDYYNLLTQQSEQDTIQSPPSTISSASKSGAKDQKLWEAIRGECIRRMRVKDQSTKKAVNLYKVITSPAHDPTMNTVIMSMANDCERSGMTTYDIVECMLELF